MMKQIGAEQLLLGVDYVGDLMKIPYCNESRLNGFLYEQPTEIKIVTNGSLFTKTSIECCGLCNRITGILARCFLFFNI